VGGSEELTPAPGKGGFPKLGFIPPIPGLFSPEREKSPENWGAPLSRKGAHFRASKRGEKIVSSLKNGASLVVGGNRGLAEQYAWGENLTIFLGATTSQRRRHFCSAWDTHCVLSKKSASPLNPPRIKRCVRLPLFLFRTTTLCGFPPREEKGYPPTNQHRASWQQEAGW